MELTYIIIKGTSHQLGLNMSTLCGIKVNPQALPVHAGSKICQDCRGAALRSATHIKDRKMTKFD